MITNPTIPIALIPHSLNIDLIISWKIITQIRERIAIKNTVKSYKSFLVI